MLAAVCVGYQGVISLAGWLGIQLSDYRMIIYALVLILVMILRPQGLLGIHELWDLWPLRLLPGCAHARPGNRRPPVGRRTSCRPADADGAKQNRAAEDPT